MPARKTAQIKHLRARIERSEKRTRAGVLSDAEGKAKRRRVVDREFKALSLQLEQLKKCFGLNNNVNSDFKAF